MLPPFCVVSSYAFILVSIPFILSSTCLGADLLPRIAYKLNLHYYINKVEPIVLCVGLVTFYSYVLLGFLFDIVQSFRRKENTTGGGRQNARFARFEKAHRQLRKMFPPFVVSSFLIYANTTRFDAFRNSFVILQTILLILQPIASMCPKPDPGLLCKFFYRSVLCWSLFYALFPRETNHLVLELTHFFHTIFDSNNNAYYSSINNRGGYGNVQQWIL